MTGRIVLFALSAAVLLAGGCEKKKSNVTREDPFVAMGDGLVWATCNVGAANPWDCGDYFAWGEAVPYYAPGHSSDNPCNDWERYVPIWADDDGTIVSRTGYNYSSYRWMERNAGSPNKITKYTVDDSNSSGRWYGIMDGQTDFGFIGDNRDGVEHKDFASYDYEDDPARQSLGAPWRTPTVEEWAALLNEDNFSWTWNDNYKGSGIAGMVVISKVEGYVGNHIFLPAAGYRDEKGLIDYGTVGDYWTASLDKTVYANYVSLYMGANFGKVEISKYGVRCLGHSIRPVREESN